MKMQTNMLALLLIACLLSPAWAQRQGRFGGRGGLGPGGGGPRVDLLMLLDNQTVQEDLDLLDEQLAEIRDLANRLRGERRRGERPDFENLSDAQRQQLAEQRRRENAESAAKTKEGLKAILLDDQLARLEQIYLQVAGTQALTQPDVVARLGLSADQIAQIEATRQETMGRVRELFQGGDRQTRPERMSELRKSTEKKIMGLLTAQQRSTFEQMKGDPIDLPDDAFFGGRRGRGGPGGDRGPRRERASER